MEVLSTLSIKNMVSTRCIQQVKQLLETQNVLVAKVFLGGADLGQYLTPTQELAIKAVLEAQGFECLTQKNAILIENIKVAVLEMIYFGNNLNTLIRNSDYLSDKLGIPYHTLSKLFSEHTQTNLERYIILVKIERVKELLSYDEMSLSEIAYQMGYSSVQYLSNQFKQITSYTVSDYKKLSPPPRIPLDKLIE